MVVGCDTDSVCCRLGMAIPDLWIDLLVRTNNVACVPLHVYLSISHRLRF